MGASGPSSIPDVVAAPIHADGTLGDWVPKHPLTDPYIHGNPAVIVGDYGYILGEFRLPNLGSVGTVLFSNLAADAKWNETTAFSPPRGGWEIQYGAATDGNFIFLAGGNPTVQQAKVAPSGGVEMWTDAPALPYVVGDAVPIVTGGSLYVFGRTDHDPAGDALRVVYAPIDGNGVGTWNDPKVNMATITYYGAAALGSYIYLAGGNYSKDVWGVALGADHTPGPFTKMAPLTDARSNACVIAGPKALYVIGGDPGAGDASSFDTAFYTIPTSDGSIVNWQETTKLPSARAGPACAIY